MYQKSDLKYKVNLQSYCRYQSDPGQLNEAIVEVKAQINTSLSKDCFGQNSASHYEFVCVLFYVITFSLTSSQ